MKTTQLSKPLIIGILVVVGIFAVQASYFEKFRMPFFFTTLFLILILVLFYQMRVLIDDTTIVVSFGVGLVKRRFPIDSIKSVEVVKTPWWVGWGIRYHPKYTLYNASGFGGVELAFKDGSGKTRIGFENPAEVVEYLSQRIT